MVGLTAAVAGLVMGCNIAADPYGLYRDTAGRRLPGYGEPRVAKYLLSAVYVPRNFNAIVIGSSVTANWDMRQVEKLRVYNESLDGGNAVELKAVVDQALTRPGISVALLIVEPYFTHSHDFETVKLEPSLRSSSLGSQNLLEAYIDMARRRFHHTAPLIDFAGTQRLDALPVQLNSTLRRLFLPGPSFEVDPIALAAYRDLVAELRAHGVQIIFIRTPIFEGLLQTKLAAFQDYDRLIAAYMTPADLVIDFRSEQFADFRGNRANFGDGIHLFTNAAAVIVSHINARIDDWMARGRLQQPPLPR